MRIDLVFPVIPPVVDGIGDHTAWLASALARHGDVRVVTAQRTFEPIPGARIECGFSVKTPQAILPLAASVKRDPPDWLVIQFNQFSYGRWGFNPFLPLALRRIKRSCPSTRLAWIAHEDFVPRTSLRFAVMGIWQRWQFRKLGGLANLIFFSIDPWRSKYASWFPETPVGHLPVGSNIPLVDADRAAERSRLGIAPNTLVVGVFGTLGASRMLGGIKNAAAGIFRETKDMVVLYVGPDVDIARRSMGGLPLIVSGAVPAEDVSRYLSTMDLHLAPFIDGVSTRRGSFLAGLQHGIASVSTMGPLTDTSLVAENGRSFVLAPVLEEDAFVGRAVELAADSSLRKRLGTSGRTFFNSTFKWENLADRLYSAMCSYQGGST